MSYATIDFDLYADIDGTIVELSQLACAYEMNRIPSCTAMLPVGYTTLFPHSASTAHAATAGVQLQIPLTVWVTLTFMAGDNTAIIPAGTYPIFCGWVTGVGYRRTAQGYALTIEGTHWLSALSFSSTLTESSHPNNPTHYKFNSQFAGGSFGHILGRTVAQSFITAGTLASDMWGDAIQPWFQELAGLDRLGSTEFQTMGGNAGNDGNQGEAATALGLFMGAGIQFDLTAVNGDWTAMAIADDISSSVLTPSARSNSLVAMANTTFWDKLIGDLGPKYFFAVIPYPTKAEVVPFIAGLRDFWDPYELGYTILARDMEMQDFNAHLPRATRAVGLMVNEGWATGANLSHKGGKNDSTIGGMYVGRNDGIVILKDAPTYLSACVIPSAYSAVSLAIDAGAVRSNAAMHPGVGLDPIAAGLRDPGDVKDDAKTILDNLAHAYYVNEVLKNRWGEISGPVRFDIAPGSTIKVEGTSGSFGGDGEARFGSVIRTSHFFDAQQQRCFTGFKLAHLRTETEHNSDDFTVTSHPLYSNTWPGDYNLFVAGGCPDFNP